MPDQKIAADPVIVNPSASASLAGIDPGTDSTKNFRFDQAAIRQWMNMSELAVKPPVIDTQSGTNQNVEIWHSPGEIRMTSATANTVTVRADNVSNVPIGAIVKIRQAGAGATTVVASGVTIHTQTNLTLPGRWSTAFIEKVAANEWYYWT